MKNINWIEEYKDYVCFLSRGTDIKEIPVETQEKAKKALEEELNNIIAINGYAELFNREIEYLKLLGRDEEIKEHNLV